MRDLERPFFSLAPSIFSRHSPLVLQKAYRNDGLATNMELVNGSERSSKKCNVLSFSEFCVRVVHLCERRSIPRCMILVLLVTLCLVIIAAPCLFCATFARPRFLLRHAFFRFYLAHVHALCIRRQCCKIIKS